MAVINKLRNSKWVMVVVLVSLLLFVLTDFISGKSTFTSSSSAVGEIDGNEIKITDFDNKYRELLAQLESNGQPGSAEEKKEQASTFAWNSFIQTLLVDKEFEKIGLDVSTEEAGKLLYSDDAHPTIKQYFSQDGVFSPSNVINFKNQVAKKDPKMMEQFEMIIQQIVSEVKGKKYNSMVSKSLYATKLDATDDFFASSNQAIGKSLTINFSSIEDKTIEVTDKDMIAYLKAHKNDFKQKESRDLEYVMLSLTPSSADTLAVKKDVAELTTDFKTTQNDSFFVNSKSDEPYDMYFQSRGHYNPAVEDAIFAAPKDSVIGPLYYDGGYSLFKITDRKLDSVYYYNVLRVDIPVQGTTSTDTAMAIEKAKKMASENKDPKGAFGFFQDKYFQGQLGSVNDMKWSRQNTQPLEIEAAVKTMNYGESRVVKSAYGLNLIVLVSPKSNQLVKVSEVRRKIEAKSETTDKFYQQLSDFRQALANSKATFEEEAKKFKLNKAVANNIKPEDKLMTQIPGTEEVVTWVYNEKREKEDVSEVIVSDAYYIVAKVSKIKEEGTADFEDVKDQLKVLVMNEKKAEQIKTKITDAMKTAKNIDEIAKKLNTNAMPFNNLMFSSPSVEFTGNDVALVGYAFGLKPKTLSNPIVSKIGVHLLIVDEIKKQEVPTSLKSRQDIIYMSKKQQISYQIFEILKKAAKVKDSRYKFY